MAEEDIIRCRCVDDEETDRNCLCLGAIAEDGMEVNVAAGGNFFPRKAINRFIIWDHGGLWVLKFLVRCPIEDVDRATLVDEDFLDCVVFYFNGADHRVILLVIEALKIVVREGYGGHATFVMRMGIWFMDWIWRRCLFLAEEVDPPLAKPPEMVLIVSRRGGSARVTSVRAGWGSGFAGWFGRLSW